MNGWDEICILLWIASILIAASTFHSRNKGSDKREFRLISLLLLEISAGGFAYNSSSFLFLLTAPPILIATSIYIITENRRWINFVVYPIFILLNIENLVNVIVKLS
jgi:hypothetical protein